MAASDFRINSQVRATLARHWIDLGKILIGCFRGTVRLGGELCHLGGHGFSHHEPAQLEALAAEIRAIGGVERVYFDFSNWKRTTTGDWICTDKPDPKATAQAAAAARAESHAVLEVRSPGGAAPAAAGNSR